MNSPRDVFPVFYANPAVQDLAHAERWTVSARLPGRETRKAPINARALLEQGRISGAYRTDEECLVALDRLTEEIPDAANTAFYLNAQVDGYAVLDIEPSCPPEISAELLKIPSLYAEESMSGRGYHLLLPLPANFWNFPIATSKKVLKEKHGYYEILLEHWVTFTRRDIVTPTPQPGAWEALYEQLASQAVATASAELDVSLDKPEIVREGQILSVMTAKPLEKSVEDFHGDHSRFEFSTMGTLYNKLRLVLLAVQDAEPNAIYGETEQSWLLYEAARALLPHRDKHDEERNGMPLLLNTAVSLIARRLADEQVQA